MADRESESRSLEVNFDPGFLTCPVVVVSSFIPGWPFFRSLRVSKHGRRRIQYKNVLGIDNPQALDRFKCIVDGCATPTWKSAIQQAWKPALRGFAFRAVLM